LKFEWNGIVLNFFF